MQCTGLLKPSSFVHNLCFNLWFLLQSVLQSALCALGSAWARLQRSQHGFCARPSAPVPSRARNPLFPSGKENPFGHCGFIQPRTGAEKFDNGKRGEGRGLLWEATDIHDNLAAAAPVSRFPTAEQQEEAKSHQHSRHTVHCPPEQEKQLHRPQRILLPGRTKGQN